MKNGRKCSVKGGVHIFVNERKVTYNICIGFIQVNLNFFRRAVEKNPLNKTGRMDIYNVFDDNIRAVLI